MLPMLKELNELIGMVIVTMFYVVPAVAGFIAVCLMWKDSRRAHHHPSPRRKFQYRGHRHGQRVFSEGIEGQAGDRRAPFGEGRSL